MADKEKGFPFDAEGPNLHTSPENRLVRDFPQQYVDGLFAEAEKKDREEFSETATMDEIKKFLEFLKEHKSALVPELDTSIRDKFDKFITLLETRTRGIDTNTFLPNRDLFNERVKKAIIDIILTDDEEKKVWQMRHTGIIAYDVRGLKVVNDANEDHLVGDAFLRRIGKETSNSSPAQKKLELSLYRIGGDEFDIFVFSPDQDLEAFTSEKELSEFFPTSIEIDFTLPIPQEDPNKPEKTLPPIRKQTFRVAEMACTIFRELQQQQPDGQVKFMSVVCMLTQALLKARTCEDIMETKVIKKHLLKANPDYKNPALEDFKMPLLVAAGGTTFFSVFRNAETRYIKRGEKLQDLNADKIVTLLMSMVLLAADQESIAEKKRQNIRWTNSSDPVEQLYADLISRNEITILLSQKLRELQKAGEELMDRFRRIMATNFELGKEKEQLKHEIEGLLKAHEAREQEIQTLIQMIHELEETIREQEQTIQELREKSSFPSA